MSSVARLKFIKTKVIFRYNTKGVSNQVLTNLDQEIKSHSCLNSSTKMGKNKNKENIFWVTKRGNKDDKSEQVLGITNRTRGITNRGSFRDFKLGQKDYNSGQRLHIGARGISNWGRD